MFVIQQLLGHVRLVFVNVEADRPDMTAGQERDKGGGIEDAAAGGVDDDDAGLGSGKLRGGDEMAGLGLWV